MSQPSTPVPAPGFDGVLPSPNIWSAAQVYELENTGVDPDGAIWAAMRAVADWSGRRVLDVGCGAGFHLPLLAAEAATVVGVEPHPPLLDLARARVATPSGQGVVPLVLAGTAQALPLPDHCIDVVHARWAYFFGPGCEPGLAELDRVMEPTGTAFVIDNDSTRSTFGGWFRRAFPGHDAAAVERFWRRHGWSVRRVDMRWQFERREDFEQVVRIEFAPELAAQILQEHSGTEVDYAVNLWHRTW